MDARGRLNKSINSVFRHMGVDGHYQRIGSAKKSVRMMIRQPDPLFELGDRQIVVDQLRIDVRVSEWPSPRKGDRLSVNEQHYSIEDEPQLDLHRLVWLLDVLPVATSTINGSRLRVR